MKPAWSGGVADMPERILWQEGDLLTQQHFQQERLRLESMLAVRFASAHAFGWGILELDIDPLLLADGLCSVVKLVAVMPDGLLINYPTLDDTPLQIELVGDEFDIKAAPICVHLAIARQPSRNEAGDGRYRLASAPAVADEMTGEDPIELERMVPRLALHVTNSPLRSPPARFVSLPLAVVGWDSEAPVLNDYVAPAIAMGPSHPMSRLASELATAMRRRASDMSQRFEGATTVGGEANGIDWTMVRAIASSLPRLEALLTIPAVHPFDLYLALCDVAGALACSDRQPLPGQLPAYDHRDAMRSFDQVTGLIESALARSGVPYQVQKFNCVAAGHFTLAMDVLEDEDEVILGLRVARGLSTSAVGDWFSQSVIASSTSCQPARVARSTGARRRRVDQNEKLWFTPPADLLIFALEIDARFIRIDEELEICGPAGLADAAPLEIVLLQRPGVGGAIDNAEISDPAIAAFQPA